jgi:hypothetical protein
MIATVVRRHLKKHAFALTLLAIVVGLVFLPAVVGRVVSPNDVYLHYDPWASVREGRAQNPLVHDPPLSYYTLAAMMKRGGHLDWNPFVGGGIPGVGSVASAMLSPFALLPALLLPLPFFFSGMLLGKVLVAFWFAYLWLREERLGKRGAALGATVVAAAGPYAVWWLWQGTNATALYPALLYACARIVRGKPNRFVFLALLALAFLLSGFPATVAYGAYLAVAYVAWGAVRHLVFPWREVRRALLAGVVALLIAAPVLDPFLGFLGRTGYLEIRADASSSHFFPWAHLRSFVQPYWLGDPVTRSWIGDSSLGPLNNFVETTVYVGLLTIPLALAGLFLVRARMRWFFVVVLVALIGMMFGEGSLAAPLADLPGFKFSPMVRLRVLLPIGAGFLAGCGLVVLDRATRRRFPGSLTARVPALVALGLAADLGLFAAWFTPQIPWRLATPPASETIDFLRAEPGVFRVAPTFPYLMPNSAQMAGIEDIRAHWGAERDWRDLLRRLDPGSVDVTTVSTFNSLRMRLDDPLLGMLNVRYLVEPPKIDIIRYLIQDRTEWAEPPELRVAIGSGDRVEIGTDPGAGCQAVAVAMSYRGRAGSDPWMEVTTLGAGGETTWRRRFDADEASLLPILHVPAAVDGVRTASVAVESNGIWAALSGDSTGRPSSGCVRFPLVLARSFRDGRVFENLDALPRAWAVWETASATREEFLEDPRIEPASVATFHGPVPLDVAGLSEVPTDERRVGIGIGALENARRRVDVEAPVAFLLVSSEKVTPELEILVDGTPARVLTVNSMFAAVLVPAGSREVEFVWKIGRGWWAWSVAGLVLLVAGGFSDRRSRVWQP